MLFVENIGIKDFSPFGVKGERIFSKKEKEEVYNPMVANKDFVDWMTVKKTLNAREIPSPFFEREVWWASLGENIGFELDGKSPDYSRPIIILKIFSENNLFYAPLTTMKCCRKRPFFFDVGEIVPGKRSRASLSHTSSMDGRRLLKKIGMLEESTFLDLKEAVRLYIFS
ncbi:MAG: hypothetical protein EOM19_00565 [Candidatus Moranbacteria bacterium]|nr:hypothetical protein [Candidatus Moranbacteria bacterium]